MALVGPNGAGKTTLLTILAGVTRSDGGTVTWADGASPRVGWVPQRPALYPRLSVRENLRLFAALEKAGDPDALAEVLIARADLEQYAGRPAAQLSTGTLQRLNLAIALAGRPSVLLLDEPTATLSPRPAPAPVGLAGRAPRGGMASCSRRSRWTRRCAAGTGSWCWRADACCSRAPRGDGRGARRRRGRRRGRRAGVHAAGVRRGEDDAPVRAALLLLRKDAVLLRRSPALLLVLVVYPILVALLVALALQSDERRPDVAVVNLDTSGRTVDVGGNRLSIDDYIDRLAEDVDVRRLDAEAAADALDAGRVSAVLTIPEGFISDLQSGVRQPAGLARAAAPRSRPTRSRAAWRPPSTASTSGSPPATSSRCSSWWTW